MAKGLYFGIGGIARKVKKLYFGIDSKARKIKKMYLGVDGRARLCFSSGPQKVPATGTPNLPVPRTYMARAVVNDICLFGGGNKPSLGVNTDEVIAINNQLSMTSTTPLNRIATGCAGGTTASGLYAVIGYGLNYINNIPQFFDGLSTYNGTLSRGYIYHQYFYWDSPSAVNNDSYLVFAGGYRADGTVATIANTVNNALVVEALGYGNNMADATAMKIGSYAVFSSGRHINSETVAWSNGLARTNLGQRGTFHGMYSGTSLGNLGIVEAREGKRILINSSLVVDIQPTSLGLGQTVGSAAKDIAIFSTFNNYSASSVKTYMINSNGVTAGDLEQSNFHMYGTSCSNSKYAIFAGSDRDGPSGIYGNQITAYEF